MKIHGSHIDQSHIEHVSLPWGSTRESNWLSRQQRASLVSVLAVPQHEDTVLDDFGELRVSVLGRVRFQAPIAALINRYHGLTRMQILWDRLRMLVDPRTEIAPALRFPTEHPSISIEGGSFIELQHIPCVHDDPPPIVIELQYHVQGLEFFRFYEGRT